MIFNKLKGFANFNANFSGLVAAKDFGKISPKMIMRTVIRAVAIPTPDCPKSPKATEVAKEDEKVLITYQSIESKDLVKELINAINLRGGIVFTNYVDPVISNILKENTTSKRITLIKDYGQFELDHFDSFINIKYNCSTKLSICQQ